MYFEPNRNCYGGLYKVPITIFNKSQLWPPRWIECDCGQLAEHVYHWKDGFPYETNRWRCKTCGLEYEHVQHTYDFVLVDNKKDKK